ncbi:hypothetical protein H0H93_007275, partial [Arthromyces matolae]
FLLQPISLIRTPWQESLIHRFSSFQSPRAGHWAGYHFQFLTTPHPVDMKTNIINILFLLIFALAASSVPVTTEVRKDGLKPVPNGELHTAHRSPAGKYSYTIDGFDYSQQDVNHSFDLWQKAHPLATSLTTNQPTNHGDLSKDQKLVIEGRYLEISNDVLGRYYPRAQVAPRVQWFMRLLLLVILEPETQAVTSDEVKSLARKTLEKFLAIEDTCGYGRLYRKKNNGRPLDDKEYLKSLLAELLGGNAPSETEHNVAHQLALIHRFPSFQSPVLDTGQDTTFKIPPDTVEMKTSITIVLFLFIFALAASSAPTAVTSEVRKDGPTPVPNGGYSYIIDGKTFSKEDVQHAINLWGQATAITGSLPADISDAQKLVIEAGYLENSKNLSRPEVLYRDVARQLRRDMEFLAELILKPSVAAVNSDAIVALARQTLEKYFQLEKQHGHDHFYLTINGSRPLGEKQFLKALSRSLRQIENGPYE